MLLSSAQSNLYPIDLLSYFCMSLTVVEAEVSVTVKHGKENLEFVMRDCQVPELYVSRLSLEPPVYLSAL